MPTHRRLIFVAQKEVPVSVDAVLTVCLRSRSLLVGGWRQSEELMRSVPRFVLLAIVQNEILRVIITFLNMILYPAPDEAIR